MAGVFKGSADENADGFKNRHPPDRDEAQQTLAGAVSASNAQPRIGVSSKPRSALPKGIIHAFLFQIANTVSWSIILGTSLLLYLTELKASGLVLGVAVALVPFFAVLQIPAAGFVERIGYKPFMVRGWAFRSIFILGAAMAPLLPQGVTSGVRIAITLVMIACFAAARGVSVCAYMPWLTQLIPVAWRGRFIAFDTVCINLSVAMTMLLSGRVLKIFPYTQTYAALFGFSYVAALLSLYFLKRIPEAEAPQSVKKGTLRQPWLAMLGYPPFTRFVMFNVCYNFVASGLGVVWVPLMRDCVGVSSSLILNLSAFSSFVAMLVSIIVGHVADKCGSRPLLAVAGGLIILNQFGWWSISMGLMPRLVWMFFAIITVGSTGFTTFQIANTRLAMGTVPELRRSHFFAILSVANSMTLGLMPLVWGWCLDRLPSASSGTWNRFSIMYSVFITGFFLVQFVRRRLNEPHAMTTQEFLRILFLGSSKQLLQRVVVLLRRPPTMQP